MWTSLYLKGFITSPPIGAVCQFSIGKIQFQNIPQSPIVAPFLRGAQWKNVNRGDVSQGHGFMINGKLVKMITGEPERHMGPSTK
jgi:hypothetical protein